MTVKELRQLLHGADPDALIVCHVNQGLVYDIYDIVSVVHNNNRITKNGVESPSVDIRLQQFMQIGEEE